MSRSKPNGSPARPKPLRNSREERNMDALLTVLHTMGSHFSRRRRVRDGKHLPIVPSNRQVHAGLKPSARGASHQRPTSVGTNALLSGSTTTAVLRWLRPKDGPPEARSEGQRPLIRRNLIAGLLLIGMF